MSNAERMVYLAINLANPDGSVVSVTVDGILEPLGISRARWYRANRKFFLTSTGIWTVRQVEVIRVKPGRGPKPKKK